MESKFQTSFIPDKSYNKGSKMKTPLSIFFALSILIIVLAILASGVLFGYQFYLNRQIATKEAALSQKQAQINPDDIQQIVKVDNKLQAATALLNGHSAVSSVFSLLEADTLKNLSFTSFKFEYVSANKISMSMAGIAKNFGVVAKQQELFSSNSVKKNLKNPVFSDLSLDDKGNVIFNFTTDINPSVISYKGTGTPAPVIVVPTSATSSASSTLKTSS
jgi:hypothetical protein